MALKAALKSKGLFQASVRSTDDNGLSVLHHAISFPEVVQCLLEELGADPDGQDKQGLTPLMHAVKFGATESASCLLEFGADHELRTHTGLGLACTFLLHISEPEVRIDMAEVLCEFGVDINIAGGSVGQTVLQLAVLEEDDDLVSSSLKTGQMFPC